MIKQSVFLENQVSGVSRFYEAPVKKIVANKPEEVCSAIIEIERALSEGLHVAGYAAYEMGYIFEPCLLELYSKPRLGPLINFGVFNSASFNLKIPSLKNGLSLSKMKPVWSEETYSKVFNKVMNYIHSGDVYQVNLTFPMVGKFNNDPFELYKSLREFQPVK